MHISKGALALAVTAALSTQAFVSSASESNDSNAKPRTGARPTHAQPNFKFPNRLRPADSVLYSQTGTADNGAPTQDMQAQLDTSDATAADDFVVTDPAGWTVSGFNFQISIGDNGNPADPPADLVYDVTVYDDVANEPSVFECDYPGIAGTLAADNSSLSITLPTTCVLAQGTYWISLTPVMDFPPQSFWSNEAGAAIGNAALWQNPGDGYGTGCTTWSELATCQGSSTLPVGNGNANFLFEVIGAVGAGAQCSNGFCLTTTVGTDTTAGACATTDTIDASIGDQLNFCYTVTNNTGHALDFHTLANNVDGTLLDLVNQPVADGGTFQFNRVDTIGASNTYTSTWTAQDAPPGYTAEVEPGGGGCGDRILADGFDGATPSCGVNNFIDITTTGTALGIGDDDAVLVTMPFTASFYGTSSNQVCVDNNGFVTLGIADCSTVSANPFLFLNGSLPSTSLPGATLMPLWDDFDSSSGNVFTSVRGNAPDRKFIVEWFGRAHFNGSVNTDTATFELILNEDGTIQFEYADVSYTAIGTSLDPADCTGGLCATIGLQKNANLFDQFAANQSAVTDRSGILWTPTQPQVFSATDSVTVNAGAPQIVINPSPVTGTVTAGGTTTIPFAVENQGDRDLNWSLSEAGASKLHFPPPGSRFAMPLGDPAKASSAAAPIALRHPVKAGAHTSHLLHVPFNAAATAFAADVYLDQVETFDVADPTNSVDVLAPVSGGQKLVGSAFIDGDFSHALAIDGFGATAGTLYSVDAATGALTQIADATNALAEQYSGMTFDPTSGKTYLSSGTCGSISHLWTVDIATGTTTLVGEITGASCIVAIATNAEGQMFGFDIISDGLVAIDAATGEAQLIGSVGFNMNYAQDATFDLATDTLYLAGFDGDNFTDVLYTVDVDTGLATPVSAIGTVLGDTDAMAIESIGGPCAQPQDLPWLSFNRTGGTTAPGDTAAITAAIDATGTAAGDVMSGTVCAHSNDPHQRMLETPITVTVDGVVAPPTVTKVFAPTSIDTASTSTLTITLSNANATPATLSAALTDTFPPNLVIAATPNATTDCGGALTAAAFTDSISLDATGSAIPANGTCTISVDVAPIANGDRINTIDPGSLQTSAGTNAVAAVATLHVDAVLVTPVVTKEFALTTIDTVSTSTLTITLANGNATPATLTAPLTDTFPANLIVAATPNATTDCGGTLTATAGGSSVSLNDDGAAIPANNSCTITVDVTSATPADYVNTIDAGALQTDSGANATATQATLTVTAAPIAPTVTVALSPTSVATDTPSTLTFTFANANAEDATLVAAFSNTLTNGLQIAALPNASTTCGGALTANGGDDTLRLDAAGSAIPANDECTIKVDVVVALPGVYSPTVAAGDLQTSEGTNVAAASDNVVVTGIFPEPYCAATASVAVEPITSVSIAGITSTSSETVGAGNSAGESENFTNVNGIAVKPGSTYPIVIKGNTNGAVTDTVHVFVDWNHDGQFTAAGEDIDLGTIDSSTGIDAVELDADIATPASAKLGLTRMRVVKAQTLTDGACGDLTNGQAEDYLILVDPNAP